MTDDHRHASAYAPRIRRLVAAIAAKMLRFQWVVTEVIQLTGENIEEDFGIRGGIDVAAFSSNSFYAARAHWSGLPLCANVMPYGELT